MLTCWMTEFIVTATEEISHLSFTEFVLTNTTTRDPKRYNIFISKFMWLKLYNIEKIYIIIIISLLFEVPYSLCRWSVYHRCQIYHPALHDVLLFRMNDNIIILTMYVNSINLLHNLLSLDDDFLLAPNSYIETECGSLIAPSVVSPPGSV